MSEKRKYDLGELIKECSDTMVQWDGESIAEQAEEILGHTVKYLGDSLFEVDEETPAFTARVID